MLRPTLTPERQAMRRLTLVLALMAAPALAQDYDACIARVETDPQAALSYAENWAQATGAPAAEHCAAMAQAALGANRAAAKRLADLAARPFAPGLTRAEILEQAATLWLEAGDVGLARAALDRALTLAPGHPGVLAARADALTAEGRHAEAAADLGRALEALPGNPALLTLRAAARRNAGDDRGALADAQAALKAAPAAPAALFELGAAQAALGEPGAARQTWLKAIAAAPDSDAADRARLSLQALDGR